MHRKEVIWLPVDAEFQAAALVFGIDHRQAPLEDVSPAVVAILAINLPNHRSTHVGPTEAAMSDHSTPLHQG